MVIYKILCKCANKMYIGQTSNIPEKRWKKHLYCLRKNQHQNSLLQNSFNKYGESEFSFEILERATTLTKLNELEIRYIENLRTISPYGYNLMHGGNNKTPSEITRLRQSKSHLGQRPHNKGKKTPDHIIRKLVSSHIGKRQSVETIEKIRATRLKSKVMCLKTGHTFESIREASRLTGLSYSFIRRHKTDFKVYPVSERVESR